jgi:TPR repeat protein
MAINWYRKAAEQGHVSAQIFLSFMYESDLAKKDNIKIVGQCDKAADQGHASAQFT